MKCYLFILFCLVPFDSIAQIDSLEQKMSDSKRIWNVRLKGSYDVPMADLAKRFGNNFRLGGGIHIKTKSNWLVGGGIQFIVGGAVKEPGLMQNIKTSNGDIINQYGELLNVGIFQRGYLVGFETGKILPYFQANSNSGLTVETGFGFMQHKINLFDRDNNIPQLRGEYKKGYDRLTNGLYLKQFLGYTYYATNKLINFNAGLELTYGFTQGRRDYWYDVDKIGTDQRNDIMLGVSFSWLIPIYKKIAEETYY